MGELLHHFEGPQSSSGVQKDAVGIAWRRTGQANAQPWFASVTPGAEVVIWEANITAEGEKLKRRGVDRYHDKKRNESSASNKGAYTATRSRQRSVNPLQLGTPNN